MELTTILVLSAILESVILVCFFVLCINVNKIKKNVAPPWRGVFNLYYSTGQIEKAREVLMKAIMTEKEFEKAFYVNTPDKYPMQKAIEGRYKKLLELVGLTINFEEVNKVL